MFDGSAFNETLVLFSYPSDAFDFVQRNSRTGDRRYAEWPCVGATGLLRVSRDPARTGSLAEHPVTDVLRTCDHARNNGRWLDGRANNAARGDANVPAYGHAKRRYNRVHPQPTLARRRRPISPNRVSPIRHGRVHENKVGRYCHRRTCSDQANAQCRTTARTHVRHPPPVSQTPQFPSSSEFTNHARKGIHRIEVRIGTFLGKRPRGVLIGSVSSFREL